MVKIKKSICDLWKLIRKPEMLILPGNLAFFLVLSVIPLISLLGFIASLFSLSIDTFITFINDFLPTNIADILVSFVSGHNADINVIIFMSIGFLLASNGPDSLIIASNILYKNANKNYIFRRIKAIFLTIILMILFIFILVVLGLGNNIIKFIIDLDVLSSISVELYYVFKFLKWPIAFVVIFLTIKLIYTIAPDFNLKSKNVNYGSFVATLVIMLGTAVYSYYVTNFGRYDIFYGSLANIIILMMFVYFISYVLVLGIAINANHYNLENIGTNKIEE